MPENGKKYLIHKKYFPRVRVTHHDGPVRPWARHQGAEPLAALVVISLAVLRDSGSWNKNENVDKMYELINFIVFLPFLSKGMTWQSPGLSAEHL